MYCADLVGCKTRIHDFSLSLGTIIGCLVLMPAVIKTSVRLDLAVGVISIAPSDDIAITKFASHLSYTYAQGFQGSDRWLCTR